MPPPHRDAAAASAAPAGPRDTAAGAWRLGFERATEAAVIFVVARADPSAAFGGSGCADLRGAGSGENVRLQFVHANQAAQDRARFLGAHSGGGSGAVDAVFCADIFAEFRHTCSQVVAEGRPIERLLPEPIALLGGDRRSAPRPHSAASVPLRVEPFGNGVVVRWSPPASSRHQAPAAPFEDDAQLEPAAAGAGGATARERQLARFLEAMPAFSAVIDADLRFRIASRDYAARFGTTPAAIVGRSMAEVLGTEAVEAVKPHLERAFAGEAQDFETELFLPALGRRIMRARYTPHFGDAATGSEAAPATGMPERRAAAIVAVVADVTEERRAASELERREAEFRNLFELSAVGAAQADARTGRFVRVNRRYCEITGRTESDLLQRTVSELTHPDDRERDQALIQQMLAGAIDSWESEKRYIRPDGSTVWVHVAGRMIEDETGGPIRTIAHIVDISESKRAEEQLRETRARERTYLEHLPVGIWFANARAELMYGNPEGQRIWAGARYVGPDRFGEYKAWWHDTGKRIEADEWAVARALRAGETSLNEEIDIECFDGTRKTILNSAAPVRDAAGEIIGAVVINQDITQQKQAERALRSHAQFVRRVLDSLYAFVGVMEPDGTLIEANRAPLEAAGITAEDVIGRKFWECYWWSYSPELQARLQDDIRRAREGEVIRYDVQVRMKNETLMWIDFQISPLRDESGRITHLIPSGIDLTPRRTAEEALRESEAKLSAIIERLPVGVGMVDETGRTIMLNPAGLRMHGFESVEEMIGSLAEYRDEFVLRYPDGRLMPAEEWPIARALRGEFVTDCEVRLTRARTRLNRIISYSAVPLPLVEPRARRIVFVLQDITERKRSEQELQKALALIEGITQGTEDMIAAADGDLRIIYFNEAYRREFRRLWDHELAIGESLPEVLSKWPDEKRKAEEIWQRALQGETYSITLDFGKEATDRQIYDLRFNPVRDGDGTLIGAAHILRNVTHREHMQQALAESEDKFRRAFSTSPSIKAITSLSSGRFIEVNESFETIMGYARAAVVGRTAEEVGLWPDLSLRDEFAARLRREERVRDVEIVLRAADGTLRTVVFSAVNINLGGELCVLSSWLDITERKRHEEQMRDVMAELNHRVKNTLAVVQSMVSQTLRTSRDLRSFGEGLRQRLHSMAQAHNLLTQSEWQGAELRKIVDTELKARVASDEQCAIRGPFVTLPPKAALAMHMVIHELATNACKYGGLKTHEGRIHITWSVGPGVEGEGRMLELEWNEVCPHPVQPPEEFGFGSRLIERLVEYELRGVVEREFHPRGLRCHISVPLREHVSSSLPLPRTLRDPGFKQPEADAQTTI